MTISIGVIVLIGFVVLALLFVALLFGGGIMAMLSKAFAKPTAPAKPVDPSIPPPATPAAPAISADLVAKLMAFLQKPSTDAAQMGMVKPAVELVEKKFPIAAAAADKLLSMALSGHPDLLTEAVQMGLIHPDPMIQSQAKAALATAMATAPDAAPAAPAPAKAA